MMTDEIKLAPGAVNYAPGLVDAEVFAGRLKAGETPVHLTGGVVPADTIFEACAEAAYDAPQAQSGGMELHHVVARDVIQAIIDRTPSPDTVQELTRILREGGVDVPEATFD